MDTRKIGGFLRTLRREKGLTQEELAEQLFVSGRAFWQRPCFLQEPFCAASDCFG